MNVNAVESARLECVCLLDKPPTLRYMCASVYVVCIVCIGECMRVCMCSLCMYECMYIPILHIVTVR
jgi:hypothetical protein